MLLAYAKNKRADLLRLCKANQRFCYSIPHLLCGNTALTGNPKHLGFPAKRISSDYIEFIVTQRKLRFF